MTTCNSLNPDHSLDSFVCCRKFCITSGGREASCVCSLESISPSYESFILCGNKLCASCNAFKRHIWHLGEILPGHLQLCRLSTYLLDPQEVLYEGDIHLKEQVTRSLGGKGQNISPT